jgi:cold shock CspA family protein/ribosome-associated translation inhibitor RaiA
MELPVQLTFRHMDPSTAVEARIQKEAAKLGRLCDHIISCQVIVEAPHEHQHKGKLYHIRIDLTVPDAQLSVSRERHDRQAHEDVYVAIRDTFSAAQRQLDNYVRRRRGKIKNSGASVSLGQQQNPGYKPVASIGRVKVLYPYEDCGTLETVNGREIYFHRNSVLTPGFDNLEEGKEVRFVEEPGDEGPQASTVYF